MKKLTLLLAALFIIAFMNLSAQISFEKTFGGTGWDQGYSVQQTTDGGYIIAGLTKALGANDWDIYVVKTDDGGNML